MCGQKRKRRGRAGPRVCMISLWRDDMERGLIFRAEHLLEKAEAHPNTRFIWVVGDSQDATADALRTIAEAAGATVTIVEHDTNSPLRLRRLSLSGNEALQRVEPSDDYVLFHESDLLSPADLISLLLATGKSVIAGWPTLTVKGTKVFYDTWAYRKDGGLFRNHWPYHACYKPDACFEVDSVGSCFMFPAAIPLQGVRCTHRAVLDLCLEIKLRGGHIWVDPTIEIVQPAELWISRTLPR